MYKDYVTPQPVIKYEINIVDMQQTCFGCPTVFDFIDEGGDRYYFRLRHGGAYIQCETNNEVLVSESMEGYDGICNWNDVVNWARKNGVLLNY